MMINEKLSVSETKKPWKLTAIDYISSTVEMDLALIQGRYGAKQVKCTQIPLTYWLRPTTQNNENAPG